MRRFTLEEAVEVLEACGALESLAAGYAALRRSDDDARELQTLVADMERLHGEGELLAMSERNAVMHRRILEISGHKVARDICSRLHSQVVRFQYRTVLAPGRPQKSLAEHGRIVARRPRRGRAGDARALEQRRRRARGRRGAPARRRRLS